jgi:Fe-S cluster assembly ATP-binding protein
VGGEMISGYEKNFSSPKDLLFIIKMAIEVTMSLLKVDNLKVKIENRIILDGISFEIKNGESHILFGPNGSGKTTLISAIIGLPLYEVLSGKIFFMGTDITAKSIEERSKMGIAVGFQNPPEITGIKLADLLKLCLGKDQNEDFSEEEKNLIEAFKLTDFLNRDINVGFSGGERKRSEILQLIFLKPKLLILDEPDSGVDVESLKLIANQIQHYVENSGSSALIITHQGEILTYIKAKYGCVLLDGKIHCFSDPKHIYDDIKKKGYEGCIKCEEKTLERW